MKRTPEQIDAVLDVVRKAWNAAPDARLCQLISNAVYAADFIYANDIFHVGDERLMNALRKLSDAQTGVKE